MAYPWKSIFEETQAHYSCDRSYNNGTYIPATTSCAGLSSGFEMTVKHDENAIQIRLCVFLQLCVSNGF
jgi:hypothetical protein